MSAKEFKEKGYVLVKDAINQELRDIITQYALFDEMQDFSPDPSKQVPKAHSKYADPAMEAMLLYLQPLIEKSTGLELYPTYSYYRVYRNGDILYPHTDRESCEISITICFNYSYEDSEYTWPIIMDGNKIDMKPGDIVIYRGIDLEHSREKFSPPGEHWHVQAFLHYVNKNGYNSGWKWDKRGSVGELKNNKILLLEGKKYINYV